MANTYGPNDVYSNIPPLDDRGENQIAKFQYWNPDPIGTSDARLAQIHPDMQAVINKAKADNPNLPFIVGSGLRSQADQQNAYKWGWSTVNPNTTKDANQRGIAADLWPLDANGKPTFDPQAMAAVGAAVKKAASDLGTPITWGGDWNTFKDRSHFQLNNPSPGYTPGQPLAPGPQPNLDGKTAPPPAPGTPAMSGRGAYDTSPAAPASVSQPSSAQPTPGTTLNSSSVIDALSRNIAGIESGGFKNPYSALGPVVPGRGQAIGKYQVMPENVPGWTLAATGHQMTPDQFRADPNAQEAVFRDQMQRSLQLYSPTDAASIWFTGKPYSLAGGGANDKYTTNANYVARATAGIPNAGTVGTTLAAAANAPVDTAPGRASAGASGSPASVAATSAAAPTSALPGFAPAQANQFLQGASGLDKAMGGKGLEGQPGYGDGGPEQMRPPPMLQAPPAHFPNPQMAAQTYGQILNSMRTPLQWGAGAPGAPPMYANAGPQVAAGVPQGMSAQELQQLQMQLMMGDNYSGTTLGSSPFGGMGYG